MIRVKIGKHPSKITLDVNKTTKLKLLDWKPSNFLKIQKLTLPLPKSPVMKLKVLLIRPRLSSQLSSSFNQQLFPFKLRNKSETTSFLLHKESNKIPESSYLVTQPSYSFHPKEGALEIGLPYYIREQKTTNQQD